MSWRIHLTNQAIQSLHILPGRSPVLVIWTRNNRVHFYDLDTGVLLSERIIPTAPKQPRHSDAWQEFAATLTGPDQVYYLPFVRANGTDIFATDDGKLRLYRVQDNEFYMETDGAEEALTIAEADRFLTLDLDRALGTVAALDEQYRLHVYQQNIRVGAFDLAFQSDLNLQPAVAVSRGGSSIFASDGRHLIATDSSGKIKKRIETHYYIRRMVCSPGGGMVMTSDMESGVLRVYRGDDLTLTHQKFAIDLVADAAQIQLLADLPPMGTSISALTAYSRGVLAFAMSGVVCVTDVTYMDELPRPKALL